MAMRLPNIGQMDDSQWRLYVATQFNALLQKQAETNGSVRTNTTMITENCRQIEALRVADRIRMAKLSGAAAVGGFIAAILGWLAGIVLPVIQQLV